MDQSDLFIIQKDEFTIDIDKVNLIKETEDHLHNVFKVKCLLGDIVADDGKQWMEIQGSADKRSQAKDYIRALCNPVEVAEIKYPVELAELITGRELRYRIEKQSGVALHYEESGKVTIGGNDAVSVTVAYSMLEDIIGQHWDETIEEASRKSKRLDAELRRLSSENELEMESDFPSLNNTIKRVIIDVLKTDVSGKLSPSLDDYGIKPWFGPVAGNAHDDSPKQETSKGSVGLSDAAKQLKQIDLESLSDSEDIKQNNSSSSVTDDPGKYLKEYALDRDYSEELVENIFAAYGRDINFALFFRALTGLVEIPKGAATTEQAKLSDAIDTTSNGAKEASSLDTNSLMANYAARLSKDHEEEVDILNLDELKKRNAERQRLLLQALEKRVGMDHEDSVVDLCGESVVSADRSDVLVDVDLTKDDLSDETDAHSSHQAHGSGHRRAPYERHHEAYRSRSPLDHRMPDGPGSPRQAQKNRALGAVGTLHPSSLRHIVIDGSNVAMTHGNGKVFSCRGIDIVVDYFIRRGHKDITVFIPQWRTCTQSDYKISDQHLLGILKEKGYLVLTPSRKIPGKNIVCYDDRYVIRLAQEVDGVIVSNDNYRDLWYERPDWREIIEYRLLMFSFVGDLFMPPDDPLGKDGPSLTVFLQKSQTQSEVGQNRPMNSQMSYVQHRPMRGPPPQRYRLMAPRNVPLIYPPPNFPWPQINPYAQNWPRPWNQIVQGMPPPRMHQPAKPRFSENFDSFDGDTNNSSTAGNVSRQRNQGEQPGPRQASEWKQVLHKNRKPSFTKVRDEPTTRQLVQSMMKIFTDCDEVIQHVLEDNPAEEDLNTLSDFVLNYMSNS